MKGFIGINLKADATVTMTAKEYLEAIERHQQTLLEWAIKHERERIIKLLDECLDWSYDIGIADKESGCQIDVEQLIYLIKGEQK